MAPSRIGKYELVAKIGRGAMGEVHKAHDPVLARFVAIKTISSLIDADEPQRQRFLREAQSAAQLNHPNIITIFDFGEEQGMAFIVMELLEGTDLKDLVDNRGLTRLEDKLAIMEQIADGLAFAHARGMVHRDLKPGNIHVLPTGQVKIMDFGLARRLSDSSRTEEIQGTPNYMSPEQVKGERATPRSDIFSLGAVFYELLCNRKPFSADTIAAVLFNVVHREADPLTKYLPEMPAFDAVLGRCLAKDASARFADAGELREALRGLRQALGGVEQASSALAASLASDTALIPPSRPTPQPLSEAPDTEGSVKDALAELEEYLADRLPPLIVAESIGVLLGCPPEGVASDIYAWAARQGRGKAPVELIYHALRKLHQMGELKLIEKERLESYLGQVAAAILPFCPPSDQDLLQRALEELRRAGSAEAAAPSEGRAEPPALPADEGADRTLQLLLERLRQEMGGASAAAEQSRSQLVAQALTAVAFGARNGSELDTQLDRLRQFGVEAGMRQVFHSLGQSLPDFIVPSTTGASAPGAEGREVQAMRRIIILAEEPLEIARRFRELVHAAIDEFNQGNLGRAVTMIELADSVVQQKQIETTYVGIIRNKGHESLDPARVRSFAENADKHTLLRKVLNFFFFGLGVPALIDELQAEQRRDKRRLLLTLLQVHGLAARQTALKRLAAFVEGRDDPGVFLLRNLVHLLRLIPRPESEAPEGEIDIVARLAEPGSPALLVRESVNHLGFTRHAKARQVLTQLLHDYEARLARPDLPPEKQEEAYAALDRLCAGLARQGGSAAWTEVVHHALSRQPALGDTLSRLSVLSGQDLSAAPPLVERLLKELEATLPRSVLGFKVSKKDREALCLIEALSGTALPEVRDTLESVVERFPTDAFTRQASRALESLEPTSPLPGLPAASYTGELELFGLPSLLHRLGDPRATGRLTLRDREGRVVATLDLVGGRLASCETAALKGPEALYQLIERPFAGSFAFDAQGVGSEAPAEGFLDVASLTAEGIRRYGELQRTSALVPDDASLEPTGASPTSVPDEPDYALVVTLWEKACAGVTPRQLEAEILLDSFRIRRALAHWFEEGALGRRLAPPAAAPATA